MIVYWEGKMVPVEEARVPVLDPGFLFGTGTFTTAKLVDAQLQFWNRHQARLGFEVDLKILRELVRQNGAESGVWKLKVVRTGGGRDLIMLEPYVAAAKRPLKVGIYPEPYMWPAGRKKTLGHGARLVVLEWSKEQGFDDAITTTENGVLLEGSFGNLLWGVDGELFTPCSSLPILPGVVAQVLDPTPVKATLEAIPEGAAFYLTNSLMGLVPVSTLVWDGGHRTGSPGDPSLADRVDEAADRELVDLRSPAYDLMGSIG